MPVRRVMPRSERGSIKDLAHSKDKEEEIPLTPSEVRLKKLYEFAHTYKDVKLQQALGIVTTDYIGDKTALPLSVYRLRQVVADIKSRSGEAIDKLAREISEYIRDEISPETVDYLSARKRIKTASRRKPPVFRRVS